MHGLLVMVVVLFICLCNRDWFEYYHETNNGSNTYTGNDRLDQIKGYAYICVSMPYGILKEIQNVMHVLGIKNNLILVSIITNQD